MSSELYLNSDSEELQLGTIALISLLPRIWKRSSVLWVLKLSQFQQETCSQIAYVILPVFISAFGKGNEKLWREMNNLPEDNMWHKNIIFYRELQWEELMV